MSRPKTVRKRTSKTRATSAGNKAGYQSDVVGVYFRDDGSPRWIVRLRYRGKDYLGTRTFPVDLKETNKGMDTHVDTARRFAEKYALEEQLKAETGKKPLAMVGSTWTLQALIERVLADFDDGVIAQGSRGFESALRTWAGKASKGHNMAGFPTITKHRITELKYKHFYDLDKPEAFNHLLKDKSGNRATNSSVKKMLKALQFAFKRARDVYEIDFVSPLGSLKTIDSNDARSRVLTDNEFVAIMKVMENGKTTMATIEATYFARGTAVRRSEAVKLNWGDIDFEQKTAHLRGTKAKRGAYRERIIPLSVAVVERLKVLHAESKDKSKGGPVFAHSYKGSWKRLRADTATQAWDRARARVAKDSDDDTILTARLHDLRHTRITELGSIPSLTVTEAARISGHNDLRMFMRYFNPNPVDIGKKLDDYERAQKEPKKAVGKGTIDEAIDALLALGDKDSMYIALGKAMQKMTEGGGQTSPTTEQGLP